MDPQLWRELQSIREMVALRYESPTKEWPLVFLEEFDALLVLREWPGGKITAYLTSEFSSALRENGRGSST